MQNKREIIVAVAFFVLGLVVMYFYSANSYKDKLAANKQITLDIIDNSTASLEASDALVNNSSNAYTEVATCFSDYKSCDLYKSQARLDQLNSEKRIIQAKLKSLTEEMDSIIAKKKSLQN